MLANTILQFQQLDVKRFIVRCNVFAAAMEIGFCIAPVKTKVCAAEPSSCYDSRGIGL